MKGMFIEYFCCIFLCLQSEEYLMSRLGLSLFIVLFKQLYETYEYYFRKGKLTKHDINNTLQDCWIIDLSVCVKYYEVDMHSHIAIKSFEFFCNVCQH